MAHLLRRIHSPILVPKIREQRDLKRIRILLAAVPHGFGNALKDFVNRCDDAELVGDVDRSLGLLIAVGETQANAVIIGSENGRSPGICSHLLGEFPHLKVVVLTDDCTQATLHELRPRPISIRPVSIPTLLEMIRVAVNG